MNITDDYILNLFRQEGLFRIRGKRIFALESSASFSPAFSLNIVRRSGRVRLDGGVGLYISKFEESWRLSLEARERALDNSLPITANVGNFFGYVSAEFYEYTDSIEEIEAGVVSMRNFLSGMPRTCDEIKSTLTSGEMMGLPLKYFLHIRDGVDENDLYFRKSAAALRWINCNCSNISDILSRALTVRQRQYLGADRK